MRSIGEMKAFKIYKVVKSDDVCVFLELQYKVVNKSAVDVRKPVDWQFNVHIFDIFS